MSSSLYQKYRPKTFSEISGQSFTIRTLTNAIKNDHVGHAYLLTGPRGTGKTTIARVFAKSINCLDLQKPKTSKQANQNTSIEPCNQCDNCKLILEDKALDLIEIDAASHTGVDNIRQLKEAVPLPPSALNYKVYIIDEVHMLSIGAFNALLKTLEEPPAHAVFILATTELHKVPETIISRCQRFDITPLSQDQITGRLAQLAKKERVKIEKEALETIALEAEGGMRDAESLLSQIIALEDKNITAKEVQQILGTSSRRLVTEFVSMIASGQTKEALTKIDQIQNEGLNLKNFNKNVLQYLRHLIIIKTNPDSAKEIIGSISQDQFKEAKEIAEKLVLEDILFLTELFQKSLEGFKDTAIPQLPLELAVVEYHVSKNQTVGDPEDISKNNPENKEPTKRENIKSPATKKGTPLRLAEQDSEEQAEKGILKDTDNKKENKKVIEKSNKKSKASNRTVTLEEILEKWSDILTEVKPHNHSIHAFLKNCTPCGIEDDSLYIKTKYAFYKDKLSENNNRLTVQKVVAKILGVSLKVVFLTEAECKDRKFESSSENKNVLHDAMQMMGGRIVKN